MRVSEERREALLAEFDRSHSSAQAFAELVGVRYSTFAGWIQRWRAARSSIVSSVQRMPPVQLVEAVLDSPPHQLLPGMVVELGGGAKVEVSNREQLTLVAELLELLSGPRTQSTRRC